MRFEPQIGEDFPLQANVIQEKRKYLKEKTRSVLALGFAACGGIIVLAASGNCFLNGECNLLNTAWSIVAAPLGWVLGHYFPYPTLQQDHHEEKDDTRTA